MSDKCVLIIGSGPAGVQAADELTSLGVSVTMIDGGHSPETITNAPEENFEDVRKTRNDQAAWFLGKDLSGIPVRGLTGGLGGGQVSGNRAYTVRDAEMLLPIATENCQIIQSLAQGGLGAAWGAACAIPDTSELHAMGLDPASLEPHLKDVIRTVGISGPSARSDVQPPLPPDLHATLALQAFEKKRARFQRKNLDVTQPLSAILTTDLGTRKASSLADMEYWSDPGRSVYRPQYTLEELKARPKFRYEGGVVAKKILTQDGGVVVETSAIKNGEEKTFHGAKVVLAAGAIGSARIALQSLGVQGKTLPFVAKPHVFTACLHFAALGKAGPKKRTSLCQLLLLDNELRQGLRSGIAQLYSYRSLMLFRLLSSQPCPCPEALRMLSLLTPALVIADIRFPAFPENGTLSLEGETLRLTCDVQRDERQKRHQSWKRIRTGLRLLGLLPVRNMELPEGSTSHYAGTLPCDENGGQLSTTRDGKLRGLEHVYVADASVFKTLPAVPHTLMIMANARRIAANVAAVL